MYISRCVFAIDVGKKGIPLSDEHKKKIGLANKGHKPWLGRHHTEEYKRNLSIARKGENNPNWKGDEVGRGALHMWIRTNFPIPELCESCNKLPPYDLSNITGVYNRERINWKYLCRSCHWTLDYSTGIRFTSEKLKEFRRQRMIGNRKGVIRQKLE